MSFSQNTQVIPFSYNQEISLEVSLTPLPPHRQKVGSEAGFVSCGVGTLKWTAMFWMVSHQKVICLLLEWLLCKKLTFIFIMLLFFNVNNGLLSGPLGTSYLHQHYFKGKINTFFYFIAERDFLLNIYKCCAFGNWRL